MANNTKINLYTTYREEDGRNTKSGRERVCAHHRALQYNLAINLACSHTSIRFYL